MILGADTLLVKEQIASWPAQLFEAAARQLIVEYLYSRRGSVGMMHV
jgi:hypothetical protein